MSTAGRPPRKNGVLECRLLPLALASLIILVQLALTSHTVDSTHSATLEAAGVRRRMQQSLPHRRLAEDASTASLMSGGVNVGVHNQLFHPVDQVYVLGPTTFPKPTDIVPGKTLVPHLRPVLGKHRPDQDAVLAFAAEYELRRYVLFIESLRNTGFTGDIVLSVSELDLQDKEIRAYLSSDPGVVVYAPKFTCFNFEKEEVESMKGGIRICQCHQLWAVQESDGTRTPISDPRPPRTVATTRYEIYWIMAINYNQDRWFLLVDSRDTIFQSNPFETVPRNTDPSGESGVLYYFGENVEATRLGQSKQNSKWLTNAYGETVANAMKDKPTICSGASMGEQIALEAYMRAMVSESDETGTVLMGADQGFHNFLFYSHKLGNAKQIRDIVVFDQGSGIVNNMGAMRTKPLASWGNGQIVRTEEISGKIHYRVLNWDGTPSPVVHQYDRHKELSNYFYKQLADDLMWKVKLRLQTKAATATN